MVLLRFQLLTTPNHRIVCMPVVHVIREQPANNTSHIDCIRARPTLIFSTSAFQCHKMILGISFFRYKVDRLKEEANEAKADEFPK